MARSGKGKGGRAQLRIIGGSWRGRKFDFTPVEGLRPTSDRIRETLFNWLTPAIHGARCADLFAGSGALGMEALSRGAQHCDFVDTSNTAIRSISQHLDTLGAMNCAHCHTMQAEHFLKSTHETYDIVFVDPPFDRQLAEPACLLLAQQQLLRPQALVYVETGSAHELGDMPHNWNLHREKVSGGVASRLYSNDA